MYKSLVAALVLAATAKAEITFAAQPVVASNLITHSSASVAWTNPGGVTTNKKLAWDTTANFIANGTLGNTKEYDSTIGYGGTIVLGMSGLPAATNITVCPLISSNSDSTNCTSTGNANSRQTFTTLALPSPHPVVPTLPASWNSAYPTINTTLTVASDCHDLNTLLASAASGTYSGQNVKVIVPSDRHVTGGAGACPVPVDPGAKSGGGWVVITSDDESNLPPENMRIDMSYVTAGLLWTIQAPTAQTYCLNFGFGVSVVDNIRFVGLHCAPALGPSTGDGNPKIQDYLVRFDGGITGMIFDRSVIDAVGYPYRVHYCLYGKGQNIGFISSYVNNCEIWQPWVTTITFSNPTAASFTASSFTMGRGNQVDSVGAFTITLNGTSGSGNAILYEQTGGAITFKYSSGSPISSCTGVTCTLDAGLSIPSDAIILTGAKTFAYTNGTFGSNNPTLWSNTTVQLLQEADGSYVVNIWESNGIMIDEGGGTTTSQNIKVQNSYIGVVGFGLFQAGDGNTIIHDTAITQNTFDSDPRGLISSTPTLSSNPWAAWRRQHVEFKNGYNALIQGNTFQNGWISENGNTAAAISMKQDLAQNPPTTRTGDITIRDNRFVNEPTCIYVAGDYGGNSPGSIVNYRWLISNIAVINNICETDGRARAQWFISRGTITTGGIFFWMDQKSEDVTVQHNTVRTFGDVASFLLRTDQCGDGLLLTDNLFILQGSGVAAYRGISAGSTGAWLPASPSCELPSNSSTTDGTAALAANYPNNGGAIVAGNVIMSGCTDATNCPDSQSSLLGSLSGQYPANNTWITTGSTFGARQNAIGWIDRTNSNYTLAATSSYNAGAHLTLDGSNPGVDIPSNQAARGIIFDPRVLGIAGGNATIAFLSSTAAAACRAAYNTTGTPVWTFTSPNTAGIPPRLISLSGLTPGTTYYYQVICTNSPPSAVQSFAAH